MMDGLKRLILGVLTRVGGNPKYAVRLAELRCQDEDLAGLAQATGIRLETLRHQRDTGLDNPGYRFRRDAGLLSFLLAHADELKGCSWLDVGADTGALSVYLAELLRSETFELCDVELAPRRNFPVRQIVGTELDYPNESFDLVFFSYVLHHAGDNTIALLRDAHRIARKYVLVLEDLKETEADARWAYADDRAGAFRGRREWLALFSVLAFSLVYEQPLDCHPHTRHVFVLAPSKASPTMG